MTANAIFLDFSARKLAQHTERIEACLDRLDETQIWDRANNSSNAIGNLILHLAGNLRQWILSGVAGAPDTRERDAEFAARGSTSKDELARLVRETAQAAVAAIRAVDEGQLTAKLRIQKYDVTVIEAIYHVVEHFAGHAGQIILQTKAFTDRSLDFYPDLNPKPAVSTDTTP